MTPLVLMLLAQSLNTNATNLNQQPLLCMDEGAYCSTRRIRAFEFNCSGSGLSCAQVGGRMTLTMTGVSNPSVTCGVGEALSWNGSAWSCVSTGGSPTVTCSSGYALFWNGSAWSCVNVIATASALASDPTACGAGQFVSDISAAGALTCSTPPGTYTLPDATSGVTGGVRLTGDLGGTATSPSVVDDSHAHTGTTISALDTGDITTGTLSGARGGLGATQPTCAAGDFLTCNGTTCSCSTPSGSGGGLTAAEAQRLVSIGGP